MNPAFHHRMLPNNHLILSFGQQIVMEPSSLVCIIRALEENAGVNSANSSLSRSLLNTITLGKQSTLQNGSTIATSSDPLGTLLTSPSNKLSRSTIRRYGSSERKGLHKVNSKGKLGNNDTELSPSLKRHDSESSLDSLDSYGSMESASDHGDTPVANPKLQDISSPQFSILNNLTDMDDADGEYSEPTFIPSTINNKISPRVNRGLPDLHVHTTSSITNTLPKRTINSGSNRSDTYSRIIDSIINTLKSEELECNITSRLPHMTRHTSLTASTTTNNFPLMRSLSFSTGSHDTNNISGKGENQDTSRSSHNKQERRKDERKARRILLAIWGLAEAINRVTEVKSQEQSRPPSRNDFLSNSISSSPIRSTMLNETNNRYDYSRGNASFTKNVSGYNLNPLSPLTSSISPPTIVSPSVNQYKGTGHWSANIRFNSFIALQQLQLFIKEKFSISPHDITNPEIVQIIRNLIERKKGKRNDTVEQVPSDNHVPLIDSPNQETNSNDTVIITKTPSPILSKTSFVIGVREAQANSSELKLKGTGSDRNLLIIDTVVNSSYIKPPIHTEHNQDTSSPNIPESPYESPLDSPTSPSTLHTPNIKNVSSNVTSSLPILNGSANISSVINFDTVANINTSVASCTTTNNSLLYGYRNNRSSKTMYANNPNNIGRASPALAQALGLSSTPILLSSNGGSYVSTSSASASSPLPIPVETRIPVKLNTTASSSSSPSDRNTNEYIHSSSNNC